jgi:hypothetical protein
MCYKQQFGEKNVKKSLFRKTNNPFVCINNMRKQQLSCSEWFSESCDGSIPEKNYG